MLGTALGWLVTSYEFPGRRLFEWALILPLALPAYVIGFAMLGLLEYPGPVQTAMRQALGPGAALPNPRSYGGVVLVMTLVFYPYVYLLARTAFREQGAATLETARTLGRTRWQAFRHVSLPMARPSLVAGASLAMMEALADFGTVATFGYRTLTEAIYRVWYGMFDRVAAAQLATLLLGFALSLLVLERALRGRARFAQSQRRGPGAERVPLAGGPAALASVACAPGAGGRVRGARRPPARVGRRRRLALDGRGARPRAGQHGGPGRRRRRRHLRPRPGPGLRRAAAPVHERAHGHAAGRPRLRAARLGHRRGRADSPGPSRSRAGRRGGMAARPPGRARADRLGRRARLRLRRAVRRGEPADAGGEPAQDPAVARRCRSLARRRHRPHPGAASTCR